MTQIYCDFSGYTDMARGTARMFGISLADNFKFPFLVANPRDFWHNWHISLSTWLRDYLFIPIGGSRGSSSFVARNLMVTMLLGGLWHGASWNFVLWGGFHGAWLVVHRIYTQPQLEQPWNGASAASPTARLPGWLLRILTLFGWIVFRCSQSTDQFVATLSALAHPSMAFNLTAPNMRWVLRRFSDRCRPSAVAAKGWSRAMASLQHRAKSVWYAVCLLASSGSTSSKQTHSFIFSFDRPCPR